MKQFFITFLLLSSIAIIALGDGPNPVPDAQISGNSTATGVLTISATTTHTGPLTLNPSALTITSSGTWRAQLGVVIGTDVQGFDSDLSDLSDGLLTGSKVGPGISASSITTGALTGIPIVGGTATGLTLAGTTNVETLAILYGTKTQIDAKNAGVDPQVSGEPAWVSDRRFLQFRDSGTNVRLHAPTLVTGTLIASGTNGTSGPADVTGGTVTFTGPCIVEIDVSVALLNQTGPLTSSAFLISSGTDNYTYIGSLISATETSSSPSTSPTVTLGASAPPTGWNFAVPFDPVAVHAGGKFSAMLFIDDSSTKEFKLQYSIDTGLAYDLICPWFIKYVCYPY